MAVLMTVAEAFSTPGAPHLLINLIVFSAGGVLFGLLMWNRTEAAYRHYLSGEELNALNRLSAKP